MADTVNIGLRIPSIHPSDTDALRSFVLEAEAVGYHSIWVGDHVFYRVDVVDPMTMLTWVAAQTTRVRLGTAVMLTAYRNPVLLAKAASSLDFLSGGRLTLGVSIGGTEAEYNSLGVAMNKRVTHLRENVAIMRKLLGRGGRRVRGQLPPRRGRDDVATASAEAGRTPVVRRQQRGDAAATCGRCDGWVGPGGAPADNFVAGVRRVREFAEEQGRDPDSLGFGKLINVSIDPSRERAFELARAHWNTYYGPNFNVERSAICGEPDAVGAALREFGEAETPEVTLILEPSNLDLDQLHLLAETMGSRARERSMTMDEGLVGIVEAGEPLRLATGFEFTEGPLWAPEGHWLFVTSAPAGIYKLVPGGEPEVARENSDQSNGMTYDLQGRVLVCEMESRQVQRWESDGSFTAMATHWDGQAAEPAQRRHLRVQRRHLLHGPRPAHGAAREGAVHQRHLPHRP